MPHGALKLIPGVDTTKTPALNEAALSSTNLIRFVSDRNNLGLPQKLGGWLKYYSTSYTSIIRALKGWNDLAGISYLAVGTEGNPANLSVINVSTNSTSNISPQENVTNAAPNGSTVGISTITGSDNVSIQDLQATQSTATAFRANGIAQFTTTTNNDFSIGDSLVISSIPSATSLNGTFTASAGGGGTSTNFSCQQSTTITNGTWLAGTATITTGTIAHNFTVGSLVTVSGMAPSGYNGSYVITAVTTYTFDYAISNPGASPATAFGTCYTNIGCGFAPGTTTTSPTISSITWSSGGGGTVTVTTSTEHGLPNGSSVVISGMSPSGYNGTYTITVTAPNYTTFTYSLAVDPGTIVTTGTAVLNATGGTVANYYLPSTQDWVYFNTPVNVGYLYLTGPYKVALVNPPAYQINVNASTNILVISRDALGGATITTTQSQLVRTGDKIIVDGSTTTNPNTFNGIVLTVTGVTSITQFTVSGYTAGAGYAGSASGGTFIPANTAGNVGYFGGTTALYTTSANSSQVQVTLANANFNVGDTYDVTVPTTVGGLTLGGNYTVTSVSSNQYNGATTGFTISAGNAVASSSASAYENSDPLTPTVSRINTVYYVSQYNSGGSIAYGIGPYGSGAYNTGATSGSTSGSPIDAWDWTLDNWGQLLVACPIRSVAGVPVGGAIYYWNPVGSSILNASYIDNSPLFNEGIFVAMPQRQLIAYGSSTNANVQDPLLVRWSDIEDFTVWNASSTNQAGSYRIPTGARIVGGMQGPQQGLIWTDLDLWAMQYVGAPYVYGFNKIAANAGLIARKAMGQLSGIVYWMSQKGFFRIAGSGPEPIPCPVWDVIFQNLYVSPTTGKVDANGNRWTDKIRCAPNTQFNEVTWYFPAANVPVYDATTGLPTGAFTSGNGEINAYVKYNVILNQWDFGYQDVSSNDVIVGRTAWIDQSVLGPPIGSGTYASTNVVGTGNYIYQHETSTDADGSAMKPYFTTGYFALAEGDLQTFIDQIWPDMKWNSYGQTATPTQSVGMTFNVTNYPTDPPYTFGPYTMTSGTEYLSVRMRGRLMSMTVNSTDLGSFWRLGNIRYRYQQDGKY
jgi:hypothetical protein